MYGFYNFHKQWLESTQEMKYTQITSGELICFIQERPVPSREDISASEGMEEGRVEWMVDKEGTLNADVEGSPIFCVQEQ